MDHHGPLPTGRAVHTFTRLRKADNHLVGENSNIGSATEWAKAQGDTLGYCKLSASDGGRCGSPRFHSHRAGADEENGVQTTHRTTT